jgi:hypothetical protein
MSKPKIDSEAARAEIDAKLDALERFSFDSEDNDDGEIDGLANLLCAFHTGKDTKVRFMTLVQVERLKRAVPRILNEHIPLVVDHYPESESARELTEHDLPLFLTCVEKMDRTRARQSASGRSAGERGVVAQLRAENAALRAQLAQGAKPEEDKEERTEPAVAA